MEIFVYADWFKTAPPTFVGTLRSTVARGQEHFSFSYDDSWLNHNEVFQIDPDLQLFPGEQHAERNQNFKSFLDSCPDRWGRLLMQRREDIMARKEDRRSRRLLESDYLLGVHDSYRMGALRFKTSPTGDFLDNNDELAAPAITSLPELEHASHQVERHSDLDDPNYLKWLNMLISPGSSLGGARPKASVRNLDNHLWLAKFPSRYDEYDIGLWEFIVYKLAIQAGINMAQCSLTRVGSEHHIFLTKRFDRTSDGQRRHFSSAMTQLNYFDGHDDGASYLELAEFLMTQGAAPEADLEELWRRLLFNILVSNTDDHLRNHGFLLDSEGWRLSPAYDINPSRWATGLHLNIDELSNALSVDLAMEVAQFFSLEKSKANQIYHEVRGAVAQWESIAQALGATAHDRHLLRDCFRV